MKDFDEALDRAAEEGARLDDEPTRHVVAVGKAGVVILLVCAAAFAISVYSIGHAKTNAGSGVAWFASAITGLFLAGAVWSAVGVVIELWRRKRAGG